ncbi:MAG: hypothetical protein HY704_03090 [Gemmatimonadetes bacterium]|nr:hypothetical protein [Gemmatimonadota bacterium]
MTRRSLAVLVLAACLPAPLRAQDADRLADRCASNDPGLGPWCAEVVQGFQALQSGLGLLAAGASDVPGSASTMGRRLRTIPRLSVSGRLGAVYLRAPDILDAESGSGGATGERSLVVPGAQMAAALGVLDGFSLLPTIGGILSLDLLASAHVLLLEPDGFRERRVGGFGYGARLGLLRESFTVPGISVSVMQRRQGDVVYGDLEGGDHSRTTFDLTTTSLRGAVGKNFLLLGLLGGVGYDRQVSDVRMVVVRPTDRAGTGNAALDGFASDRVLFFGGASLSFLLLQLSAEGGWARGQRPVPGRGASEFDPRSASLFLNLAFRITL